MLKGKNNEVVNRFVGIAFFYVLGHYGDCPGTGATSGTGNKQECIRLKEPFRGSYRVNYLVGILSGDFSAEFIYFAHAVATGLTAADEDSMLVVLSNACQPTKVSSISIDRITASNYLNATGTSRFLVHPGELIRNSTATLSETYNY
ncbi:hypothetical protein ES703_62569 [subsurface metagenome]